MVSFFVLGGLLRFPEGGDAQSSFQAVLAVMMGGCCGTGRGSRRLWREPLRRSVHGKGPEGRSLEWRSTGAGVGR